MQGELTAGEADKVLDVLAARRSATSPMPASLCRLHRDRLGPRRARGSAALLREVTGALQMLELPQPAAYLTGVRRYIEDELIDSRRVPNGRQLDTFADALASLEYYLEALRENRFNRDEILDVSRQSLESLGYWPLPAERPSSQPAAAPVDSEPAVVSEADIERTVAALIDRGGTGSLPVAEAPAPVAAKLRRLRPHRPLRAASKPPATRSTTRSARSSSKSSPRRSTTWTSCCRCGVRSPTTSSACARSGASSTR